MFLHNKKLQYTVHVDAPHAGFAKMCLEQFGGPNGELGAAMRYFTQAWAESDGPRRDMLLDIATEELSHLEMISQILTGLLKGSKGALLDEHQGSYLQDLQDGKSDDYQAMFWNSAQPILAGGSGLRLTDSMGTPWTAAYIDTIGHPLCDLRSDIAAEARAKAVYDRLLKVCPDAGAGDALKFLMTREVAHQKMFESALAAIENNFPSSNVAPDERFTHVYFDESTDGANTGSSAGFDLVQGQGLWSFELKEPYAGGNEPDMPDPKPSVASALEPADTDELVLSRVTAGQISGDDPATLPQRATKTATKSAKTKSPGKG